jgi:hypothetical protein
MNENNCNNPCISLPQIQLSIGKEGESLPPIQPRNASIAPADPSIHLYNHHHNNNRYRGIPNKSRQPHVFKDFDGNEKVFGSALGLLTRKFVDLIFVSAILCNEGGLPSWPKV